MNTSPPLNPPVPPLKPGDNWSEQTFPKVRVVRRGPQRSDEVKRIKVLPLRDWKP